MLSPLAIKRRDGSDRSDDPRKSSGACHAAAPPRDLGSNTDCRARPAHQGHRRSALPLHSSVTLISGLMDFTHVKYGRRLRYPQCVELSVERFWSDGAVGALIRVRMCAASLPRHEIMASRAWLIIGGAAATSSIASWRIRCRFRRCLLADLSFGRSTSLTQHYGQRDDHHSRYAQYRHACIRTARTPWTVPVIGPSIYVQGVAGRSVSWASARQSGQGSRIGRRRCSTSASTSSSVPVETAAAGCDRFPRLSG